MKPAKPAIFSALLRRTACSFTAVMVIFGACPQQTAFALGVPVVGWGYSIGNGLYRLGDPRQPTVSQGFGWWFDPPAPGLILSGRLTVQFDPAWSVGGAGWFGEFGADPGLPAPPIGAVEADGDLLQADPNPLMQSASIAINAALGRAVFEFDWGPDGHALSVDRLNFAGIWFSNLNDPNSPPSSSDLRILGSPGDVRRNGSNALTFMSCRAADAGSPAFFCGEHAIPEPSTIALLVTGLGASGMFSVGRRRRGPE